jgi:hypothetical protein
VLNVDLFTSVMPCAAFDSPAAVTTWILFALLKLTTGISVVFSWRMLAKPVVQTLLPPLFRWHPHASPMRLPHRRHYTPATEYSRGPPHTLRAVLSMIDLDTAMTEVVDEALPPSNSLTRPRLAASLLRTGLPDVPLDYTVRRRLGRDEHPRDTLNPTRRSLGLAAKLD